MNQNKILNEKNFTSSLVMALSLLPTAPTKAEVEEKAKQLAAVFGYTGDITPVVTEVMVAIDTRMGTGVSLIDVEAEHDNEWHLKRDNIQWTYSDAYSDFLRTGGWGSDVIQSLSDVGDKILGHLQDPTSVGSWDRRGLVIGHVQSGKTANYMGVISKAADAGYKFIIVIAGIHNNLRKQTQERIDEGFVGRSSNPENRVNIGVGLTPDYPHPATLTNIHDDFRKHTANSSGWKINDFSKPIVLVIKKNVSTLETLYDWLKEMNAAGNGQISDIPMLVIDDEADNASINTNKPDLDPTKTNAWIRSILGLFAKSCYIGYTATPFANIFINPDAYDKDVYEELFPRDFIYCLDAPSTYFGPDKVFLDEDSSDKILEPIVDCENYLRFAHKKDDLVTELPPSLYNAVNQFVIARTIRNLRGQSNKHCSMMINVSRFVVIQNRVRDFISLYTNKLKEAVKSYYAMPEAISSQNSYMRSLKTTFCNDYAHCELSWEEVKISLNNATENLRIFVVNSKSDEVLDYKKYENDGTALTAIAIGGLSLSRGLTIEGLCISYMYRNTRMYDTLMQMGRWFGYRPGFEDLCKVHLAKDSIDWYSHIAESSEELRMQIKRMRRAQLSPKQFGLYVKAHDNSLLITAPNKMRTGERLTFNQNFSGKLIESYILPTDDHINAKNEKLIAQYWKEGFGGEVKETSKGWTIQNVAVSKLEDFLTSFYTHPSFAEKKSAAISYLRLISDEFQTGDVLLISIKGKGEDALQYKLGVQERSSAKLLEKEKAWRASKLRVASRGDEGLDLTIEQRQRAQDMASNEDKDKKASDFHYRTIRNKPLLMIHVIDPEAKEDSEKRVPAFGLSFPQGNYDREVEVVANIIWVNKMHGDVIDTPDEEDDYDE
ncbi:Z1 domain-containing protein [Maridesulfovibrio sp. FT414]|uniref:Z1 domain-containing protein n=1 Tax=Maridesulfovibrio sp. FT414 TaxID=2979469 RepID=UPI003D807F19